MKNKATVLLKQVWTVMGEVLKSKTNAAKTKAGAVRTRLIVLSLVSNKKFLFSNISHKFHALLKQENVDDDEDRANIRAHEIPHKFQALLGHRTMSDVEHLTKPPQKVHALLTIGTNEREKEENSTEESKDIVMVEHSNFLVIPPVREEYPDALVAAEDDDDDDDYPDLTHCLFDSEDLGDLTLSAVDVVKQSKPPEDEFVLEDEIDRVADLFIKRFRRQMKMQNEESFMAYQAGYA